MRRHGVRPFSGKPLRLAERDQQLRPHTAVRAGRQLGGLKGHFVKTNPFFKCDHAHRVGACLVSELNRLRGPLAALGCLKEMVRKLWQMRLNLRVVQLLQRLPRQLVQTRTLGCRQLLIQGFPDQTVSELVSPELGQVALNDPALYSLFQQHEEIGIIVVSKAV